MDQKLKGQKALVTGASSGIGKAIAQELGRAGADVVINYLHGDDAANQVAAEISSSFGVKAIAHQADVSKEDEVVGMFARMQQDLGSVDIVVANAGVQKDA